MHGEPHMRLEIVFSTMNHNSVIDIVLTEDRLVTSFLYISRNLNYSAKSKGNILRQFFPIIFTYRDLTCNFSGFY